MSRAREIILVALLVCLARCTGVSGDPIALPNRPPSAEGTAQQASTASESGLGNWSWARTGDSVALVIGQTTVWQFHYSTQLDVPYFHPLSTPTGQVLSQDRPADHPWHHGFWFCWKYLNGVNYWEIDQRTGKPDGRTSWTEPQIVTRTDGTATIRMELKYAPAKQAGAPVLLEIRRIDLSAPDPRSGYQIDWNSIFTAGKEPVLLDRTPPQEQSWGGYAGLSLRFSTQLTDRRACSSEGQAKFGAGDRFRGRAVAMDYSGRVSEREVGVAFLDHTTNPRHPTPWYLVASPPMSYMNAAILAEEPLRLEPEGQFTLRYRVVVHPDRWDESRLCDAQQSFSRNVRTIEVLKGE